MNSHLHHTVVLARLADFRRVAEAERSLPRARPAPRAASRATRRALRRRVLRAAA
ncbi:MAG TPA: hypothetical protein VHF89_07520 [Solirubrobacteraceae bacterium]|nr:hypothetical protein [Solirubrobacteraceae bacterium]